MITTAKEYSKKYDLAITYKKISELAFNAGLKVGREEVKPEKVKKLEKDLKYYKQYHDEMEITIRDGDKFAELISGL